MTENHYCVRWKGFHSNILTALEDLKSDEEFVDVTLSCEGKTLQGHKLILSASSPYFRKILKENPCRHPVLILNDIQLDVLEAIMTYMYHGTVSVPHTSLQIFLKTAEALKIKGIVDCFQTSETLDEVMTPEVQVPSLHLPGPLLHPSPGPLLHPAGDLSLLASAATESAVKLEPMTAAAVTAAAAEAPGATAAAVSTAGRISNSKRRKTAPRKLGSFQPSPVHHSSGDEGAETEKENQSLLSLALTAREYSGMTCRMLAHNYNGLNGMKDEEDDEEGRNGSKEEGMRMKEEDDEGGEDEEGEDGSSAINLSTQKAFSQLYSQQKSTKQDVNGSLDLSLNKGGLYNSSIPVTSSLVSQAFQLLPAQFLNASPSQLSLMEGGAAEQMAALLGPEQMAALLGPSWKSRQPRMCQYCNRMFSNKFNLKQHILNMHTVGREMQCEICNKKVKNKWYLRRHHVTHHGAPLKK
ncbi:broad-complex core protein isoforms 1/2/3/4/5 [Eurytemora carolleeae]|uniref:broad-complex core protein isoforms 1/2/3/4/5 n=1 Tax=Eurytemora carolleeae TaxID=1294199 RepID=UPI000C75C395|nr:broad-complex core protein isoforms 1/2/3/4/5 [Eurytemora carolleeae]|eukprot:XP_023346068.1 broad-complex core protein isoforms 1/2/3/4/5-like [Eurytemora affinis]